MARTPLPLLRSLYAQRKSMADSVEWSYPKFLSEARTLLSDLRDQDRFEFVLRRIWMDHIDDDGCLPELAEAELRRLYIEFCNTFTWSVAGQPPWIDQDLIERTLSAWQPRLLQRLTAEQAVRILKGVTRLASPGGDGL